MTQPGEVRIPYDALPLVGDRLLVVYRPAFILVGRAMNVVVRRLRLRRFRGGEILLLTTTGRKSGHVRTTPLLYLAAHDRWVVVASNGGADWEPGWWLNLGAGTAATVEVDGRRIPVTGTEITGTERDRLWLLLNEKVFDYSSYQAKVSRRHAVIELAPSPS
jgi:deazaflavin-dependent oxidoreductase (nitroreductase family)